MNDPEILPEKDVFGLDKPHGAPSMPSTPASRSGNIKFAIIIVIVAAAIAVGFYFLKK
jgi:hypothetical protein